MYLRHASRYRRSHGRDVTLSIDFQGTVFFLHRIIICSGIIYLHLLLALDFNDGMKHSKENNTMPWASEQWFSTTIYRKRKCWIWILNISRTFVNPSYIRWPFRSCRVAHRKIRIFFFLFLATNDLWNTNKKFMSHRKIQMWRRVARNDRIDANAQKPFQFGFALDLPRRDVTYLVHTQVFTMILIALVARRSNFRNFRFFYVCHPHVLDRISFYVYREHAFHTAWIFILQRLIVDFVSPHFSHINSTLQFTTWTQSSRYIRIL